MRQRGHTLSIPSLNGNRGDKGDTHSLSPLLMVADMPLDLLLILDHVVVTSMAVPPLIQSSLPSFDPCCHQKSREHFLHEPTGVPGGTKRTT